MQEVRKKVPNPRVLKNMKNRDLEAEKKQRAGSGIPMMAAAKKSLYLLLHPF
jgi:hypothetical protein